MAKTQPGRAPVSEQNRLYEAGDDTNDRLIKAYLEYYKHNELFEKRHSVRNYRHTRRWLREITYLAKQRQREVADEWEAERVRKGL